MKQNMGFDSQKGKQLTTTLLILIRNKAANRTERQQIIPGIMIHNVVKITYHFPTHWAGFPMSAFMHGKMIFVTSFPRKLTPAHLH